MMALPMPKKTARHDAQADEVGYAVIGFDVNLALGLGRLVLGLLPGLDILVGRGVERGVLEARGGGGGLGGFGFRYGRLGSGLGLVRCLFKRRAHGLGGFLGPV